MILPPTHDNVLVCNKITLLILYCISSRGGVLYHYAKGGEHEYLSGHAFIIWSILYHFLYVF